MVKNTDLIKHVLVPKHIKMREDEKKKVLDYYNVGLSQLPRIRAKDPALRGTDVKPGDLIKIVRYSPTNVETVFYRVVTGD